jgi:hypothetical protein
MSQVLISRGKRGESNTKPKIFWGRIDTSYQSNGAYDSRWDKAQAAFELKRTTVIWQHAKPRLLNRLMNVTITIVTESVTVTEIYIYPLIGKQELAKKLKDDAFPVLDSHLNRNIHKKKTSLIVCDTVKYSRVI